MVHRLISLFALSCVTGLMIGCSQASPRVSTGPLELGASDSGRTLQVPPETMVKISLDSNVTTGYSWKLTLPENEVVKKTAQEYLEPHSQRVGEGGREIWTFRTQKPGRVTLKMEYIRPWETKAAPAKVFEVTLVVK